MKNRNGNICQSCSRPIKRITDFGTHADGSVNTDFCRQCCKDGEFLDSGISTEDKLKKNIDMAALSGNPPLEEGRKAMSVISRLYRWKKKAISTSEFLEHPRQ